MNSTWPLPSFDPQRGRMPGLLRFLTRRPPASRHFEPRAWEAAASPRRLPAVAAMIACIGGSLMLSVALFPSVIERASMYAQEGQIGRARELLERNLKDGDRSPLAIRALAEMRAASGDVKGAIELLAEPADRLGDVAAMRLLSRYYGLDRRPHQQVEVLERLRRLSHDAQDLRELARLYGELGLLQPRREVLQRLLNAGVVVTPAEYLALARLQFADAPLGAADTYARMRLAHPAAVDAGLVAAHMAALCAGGRIDKAMEIGHQWIGGGRDRLRGGAAALLAGPLIAAKRHDAAADFLGRYAAADDAEPELIAVWAQARIDTGGAKQALQRMRQARAKGAGTAELRSLHARLALSLGAIEEGWTLARELGVGWLPLADLQRLVAGALDAGRLDVIREVLATSRRDVLAADPLLAARVQLALGDAAAARRWIRIASASPDRNPLRRLQLAHVAQRLRAPSLALRSLRIATASPLPDAGLLPEIARAYIGIGAAQEGHQVLGRIRRDTPSGAADAAWALAAAATGRHAALGAWLQDTARAPASADFYRDLAHLAMDAGAPRLAVACARWLLAVRSLDADRLLMAHALLAAQEPAEALTYLRTLPRASRQAQKVYTGALLAAWRKGHPVAAELRAFWTARFEHTRDPREREEALLTLVELGAFETVLPALATLALDDPQRWLGVFTDAATRAGRRSALRDVWMRIGESAKAPGRLRTQVASRLLQDGDKVGAERIWHLLAADAPREHPAVQGLLHLWGPRPTRHRVDWIESRARRAPADDAHLWLRELIRVGAADRAADVYLSATPEVRADPRVRGAYLDALAVLGHRAASAQDAGLQRDVLRRMAAAGFATAASHKSMGRLAYQAHDWAEAERGLLAFEGLSGGDLESHTLLAGIRGRLGDAEGEKRHLQRALGVLEAEDGPGYEHRVLRARLLQRLQRDGEAAAAYAALVAERAGDKPLRADYVALLLAMGRHEQAQAVLVNR